MKRLLTSFLVFALAIQLVENSTFPEALSVALSAYLFLTFIHCIGKRLALLECVGFIAALEILLVPAITYWVFPASMPVESSVYFSYALPAFLAFWIGLCGFTNNQSGHAHKRSLQAAQTYVKSKHASGVILFLIGLSGFLIKIFVPNAPNSIGTLPSYCLFISAFYAYYSGSRFRLPTIGTIISVLLIYTVRAGMFGELFFWLMLMTMVEVAGRSDSVTNLTKTVFVLLAFSFLLLIQSVKGEYRYFTWGHQRSERNGDASLMVDLVTDRVSNPEKLLNVDHLFLAFVRFNQGIMIGSAMAKVPTHEDFAGGEVLLSFVYPIIPRIVWPDKPQTGGHENIRRFTTLAQSENTSINLSPLGEGYVNFGYGGILFTLLYGLLLGGVFQYIFHLALQTPSLVFWLPMLYIGCLTMETDVLSTWGSLINNAIFIGLLFWLLKRVGLQL